MVTKYSKMYKLSELELNPTIKKIGGCYSIKIKYGKKAKKNQLCTLERMLLRIDRR